MGYRLFETGAYMASIGLLWLIWLLLYERVLPTLLVWIVGICHKIGLID